MNNDVMELMKWGKMKLECSNVPCAGKDAEALLTHSFKIHREKIIEGTHKPSREKIALFRHYIKLRASRFPLQYILKNTEFMGFLFKLEKGVFIPRPETELLVEKTLKYIKSMDRKRVNMLEIGTGCGNVAISLTKNASGCKIIASDISDKALKIAVKNAAEHGVRRNIKFIKSTYFNNISTVYYNYFDIIVSNPPYIRRAEIKRLEREIAYEDIKALDGGEDGLYAYRRILNDGTRFLKNGGAFLFEIGYDQAASVERIIKSDGRFSRPIFYKDYSGYNRVAVAKYQNGKR